MYPAPPAGREQNETPITQTSQRPTETLKCTQVHGTEWDPLGELEKVLIEPLSVIYRLFWLAWEVPVDWIARSLGPISMSMKGRSCLANLITFCDSLVDEGKAMDVAYLNISKTLDTVSYRILLEKLATPVLDECIHCWVENWLDG